MKNKLIVFEGIDGVGKTTLSRLLQKKLIAHGCKAIRYEDFEDKNSGFNAIKPFIKKFVPVNASLLFYVASAIYKSQQIEELLKHKWVICDRYIYSTLAYHKIRAAQMSLSPKINTLPVRLPDFLFLIKVGEKVRLQRAKKRITSNPSDFKRKTNNNLIGKMEQGIEKFKPIIIDNTFSTPDDIVEKIYQTIIKNQ